MSESRTPGRAGAYQRSSGGLVGAMVITVLVVLAFVVFRGVTRDNESTPVRSVDYQAMVRAGRADHKLVLVAPESLPHGWEATSATYLTGVSPTWHLGLLTDRRKYVGVEEARASIRDLVEQHVDQAAERGKDVVIGGATWQTWTDAGGDYAVARELKAAGSPVESWVVVGTAPEAQIRDLAGALKGGSAHLAG